MSATTLCCPLHFGPHQTRPTLRNNPIGDGTGRAVLDCTSLSCEYWTIVSATELTRLTGAKAAA